MEATPSPAFDGAPVDDVPGDGARRPTHVVRAVRLGGVPGATRPDTSVLDDELVVEAPLEVRLDGDLVATTMRTPGHDFELALGLLWAERRISSARVGVRRCPEQGSPLSRPGDVVCVDTPRGAGTGRNASDAAGTPGASRLGLTASSCGVCGVEQIESLVSGLEAVGGVPPTHRQLLDWVTALDRGGDPGAEPQQSPQGLFERTGGSHAAAALDAEGEILVLREDIGRHNAVDKVVGSLLSGGTLPALGTDGRPEQSRPAETARPAALWVSGRASFEIVQKCWAAGIPALVSVGAASALAVDTADRAGITLAGFAREGRATVYTGAPAAGDDPDPSEEP